MRLQRLGGDTDLARYRLTAPHFVTNRLGVPALKEAGSILDSLDLPPHWQLTPAMEPLDDEAEAEHAKVIHEATAGGTQVEITGFGHLRNLPRGHKHLPKANPAAQLKSRYYWVSSAFTYTSKSGVARMVDPKDPRAFDPGWSGNIFDSADPRWDLPDDWEPPPSLQPFNPEQQRR